MRCLKFIPWPVVGLMSWIGMELGRATPVALAERDSIPIVQPFLASSSLVQVQQWGEEALSQEQEGDRLGADQAMSRAWTILSALENPNSETWVQVKAQLWNRQGQLQWMRLDPQAALASWQTAQAAYQSVGDEVGVIGTQINEIQVLQTLGQYRRAIQLAETVEAALVTPDQETPNLDPLTHRLALQQLGQVFAHTGQLQRADQVLKQVLFLTQSPQERSQLLLLLGNTARSLAHQSDRLWKLDSAQSYQMQAWDYYQGAAKLNPDSSTALEIQVNQFSLWVDGQRKLLEDREVLPWETNLSDLQEVLSHGSPSVSLFQARLHFVYTLLQFQRSLGNNDPANDRALASTTIPPLAETIPLLTQNLIQLQAVATGSNASLQSTGLQSQRLQSETLGLLGEVYREQGQIPAAIETLQSALVQAEAIYATDLIALWQWQMGKTLAFGDPSQQREAAEYYSAAFHTVQSLRGSLVEMSVDTGFSLQSQLSPLYRDYIQFLLSQPTPSQNDLAQALEVMEALQLVDLNNFFQEPCLTFQPLTLTAALAQSHTPAAAVYSIILPDALAVILLTPDGTLRHAVHPVSNPTLTKTALLMRSSFNPAFDDRKHLSISRTLYGWLVEPFVAELAAQGTETLVFVLDGVLRNVPMAALHDGSQYLIEQYQVTLTPGLKIVPPNPQGRQRSEILIAGLSQGRSGFHDLPGVLREATNLQETFAQSQLKSHQLLDEKFTYRQLEHHLRQGKATILHLATHGQFSSDPNETFILTGDDWTDPDTSRNRIVAKDLTHLFQLTPQTLNPLDLLVFSACQTALGDEQASLGLAGLAARSGASSTIGTLWAIDDEATADFMIDFYHGLIQEKLTKGEAMRRSQLKFLARQDEYKHPYYWSPFVLIGNWN